VGVQRGSDARPPGAGGLKGSPQGIAVPANFGTHPPTGIKLQQWAELVLRVLTPGGHAFIATSPLFNHVVSQALVSAGLEKRGEIVRLVRTLRGGDRPKGAESEFPEVSAMPRSSWEPWLVFRKRLEGTLAENLRTWATGGLRRPLPRAPFTDVVASGRTPREEKQIAPHPSLKPQGFLRQLVRAALPLGQGVVLDPFAGSGSTLAACKAIGYQAIGIESDQRYVKMAVQAIPRLAAINPAVHSAVLVHMWDPDTTGSPAASPSRNGELKL